MPHRHSQKVFLTEWNTEFSQVHQKIDALASTVGSLASRVAHLEQNCNHIEVGQGRDDNEITLDFAFGACVETTPFSLP